MFNCAGRRDLRGVEMLSKPSITVVALALGSHLAIADQRDEAIRALMEKVDALEQKVKALEHDRDTRNGEGPTSTNRSQVPIISAGSNGFAIQSADTNFVLRIKGYVQADSRFFIDDDTAVNDTFLLRRVRPIFEGTVFRDYDYRLMLDFGSGLTTTSNNVGLLQDAYVNAHYWREFQVQVGKMKEPVGLERLRSAADLTFPERGYPTQLVPSRDVGIMLHGKLFEDRLSYAAGLFNGVNDGGSGDIETDDDEKDFAARVFAAPFKQSNIDPLQGLGFGIAGTIGNQEGPLRSFSTAGQEKFFSYRTGDGLTPATANISADGQHWRLVPQACYYWGPFGLLTEYAISNQRLRRDAGVSSFADIQNTAWQVAASYILTGEENSYQSFVPKRPLSLRDGGWGAWEVTARVMELSIDDSAFPSFAKTGSAEDAFTYGVGLNWYLNKNVKMNLECERTTFTGGSRTPGSVTAQPENVIFTRVQFGF